MPDPWTGTFVVGGMQCSYAAIVRAFGEPTETDGDEVEWRLMLASEDGPVLATIYPCPNGADPRRGRPASIRTDWHIGGFGPEAAAIVRARMGLPAREPEHCVD